jgi:hypothetical protein
VKRASGYSCPRYQKEKRSYESDGAFSFSIALILILNFSIIALFFQNQHENEIDEEHQAV